MENVLKKITGLAEIYHELSDSINNIIFVLDKNFKIAYISQVVERVSGYKQDELVGRYFFDIFNQHGSMKDHDKEGTIDPDFPVYMNTKADEVLTFNCSTLNNNTDNDYNIGILVLNNTPLQNNEDTFYLYKHIADLSPVSIIITNAGGMIEYVNSGFEKMTGYASQDVVGKNVRILKSGLHPQQFYRELWDSLRKRQVWSGDFYNKRKDGYKYWESAIISPVYSAGNKPTHYIKVAEDVTAQKNMVEMLVRSYEFIENVMNNINPVFVIDRDGQFVLINQIFSHLTGYTTVEIIGKPLSLLFDEHSFSGVKQLIDRAMSDREQCNQYETTIINKDHSSHFITMNIAPLLQEDEVSYLVCTMDDISERVKAEAELKKLSYAINQSPVSVVITDAEGVIEYINPKFTEITGYSSEQIIGKTPGILNSGTHDKLFYEQLWETVLSGKVWSGEFLNRKKNGELYWESATISPIRDKKNIITHIIGIKEDITEKKMALEALRISEENLRKRNRTIEKDLSYAQKIIKKLLPVTIPENRHILIYYKYMPVDAIGGDFFSFIETGANGFGIFLCDVVGHGVSAALFLSLVKSETDRISRRLAGSPAAFMSELNRQLTENVTVDFLTAIYAIFEISDDGIKFTFSRAGHPLPVLCREQSGEVLILENSGKPLGLVKDIEYSQRSVVLHNGDQVFLYTDGISETFNRAGVMLGTDGLSDIFKRLNNINLKKKIGNVLEEVKKYRGSKIADDDAIMLGFQIRE